LRGYVHTVKLEQQEELAVLASIYSDEWQTVDSENHVYKIEICRKSTKGSRTVILQVSLPADYPSSSPPVVELSATWMADEDMAVMLSHLDAVTSSNVGDPVLYQYIECIRDYMDSLPEDTCNMPDIEPASEGDEQLQSEPPTDDVGVSSLELQESLERCVGDSVLQEDIKTMVVDDVQCPKISHGEPLIDRKSAFQAHLAPVTSKSETLCLCINAHYLKCIVNWS
jgi:hypothetical protein